ncbi:unnamed protein product [Prorocentrum cordatum]|uniref:Uncharacterized protein n=1 Tax=Prorocentrum cordatum TaxID=2364126 RepID=A0ABN9QVY6_9DINO|nr:unnamed protein product [Polarella glacialis]
MRAIREAQAGAEVLCPDKWNNLTRLLDRGTCVFVVFPSVLWFALWRRPWQQLLPFIAAFGAAWLSCAIGIRYRDQHPCGVRRPVTYGMFMVFHELWHWLLFLALTANALDRRAGSSPQSCTGAGHMC